MKTIHQDCAFDLYRKMESLRYQPHDSWRAIYIKLSDKQSYQNRNADFVADVIAESLTEKDGTIYTCNDGDAFILFQGSINPVLSKVTSYFKYLAPIHLRERPLDTLFYAYDLRHDWESFYRICETKYLEALARSEEQRGHFRYAPEQAMFAQRA